MKWLQVLLFNTIFSIQYYSFICTQTNGSKYCHVYKYFNIDTPVNVFQVLLINTNNSIEHYSFVYTQLNSSKYCYVSLTIQLNISDLLT